MALCEASDTPHNPRCDEEVGLCSSAAISASCVTSAAAEQAPLNCRARAGGRRLSAHAEAVTAIMSSGSFDTKPAEDLSVPIRHLRVMYGIPNAQHHKWCREHTPTGYEFFAPHSSLHTYNSPAMQQFLRQMSSANQFRVVVRDPP